MKVYDVEFRAAVQVAAESEKQAGEIALSAIQGEPKLIYIASIDGRTFDPVWEESESIRPDAVIIEATPAAPTAEATGAYEITSGKTEDELMEEIMDARRHAKDNKCIGEPPL